MSQEEYMESVGDSVDDTSKQTIPEVEENEVETQQQQQQQRPKHNSSKNSDPVGPASFNNISSLSSSRGIAGTGSGSGSGDDKHTKRINLRNKFEQYLKESKQEDNNARYEEALERLKKDKDAAEFNLVCRQKGDQKTGLIILNRLARKSSTPAAVIPVSKVSKEMESKPVTKEPEKPAEDEEEMQENSESPVAEIPVRSSVAKRKTNANPEKSIREPRKRPAPTASSSRSAPSKRSVNESTIIGLANKIDSLEETIARLKRKQADKKMHKEAKRSFKENLRRDTATEKKTPRTEKERFYAILEAATAPEPRPEKVIDIFKRLY